MMSNTISAVSIIIPAYNEERNIEEMLLRTHSTMEKTGLPYEILVIDDGSTDRTRLLAERHKVTIVANGINRGKGHALKMGFQKACGEVIVTLDADCSHRPEEIPKLLKLLSNGVDIVTGSRFTGKKETSAIKGLHLFGNKLFNLLIRVLTKESVTDSQTGFRVFKRKVIEETEIACDGYAIETELTVKTLKNGFIMKEEPITFARRKNGCSHVNPLIDGARIFRTIIVASIEARSK
jgi:glycosyltransferase involved in cell wall biosynthesis